MITTNGKQLPKFNKTPSIFITSSMGLYTELTAETTEYFDITVVFSMLSDYKCIDCEFTLMIFQ